MEALAIAWCVVLITALAQQNTPRPPKGMATFVKTWESQLAAADGYQPMPHEQLRVLLVDLAERLRVAALADPFVADDVEQVGVALVQARLIEPSHLGRTQWLVGVDLPECAGLDQTDRPQRLAEVQAALSAGYAHALRAVTMADQEELSRAALRAREAVEERLRASEARFRTVFEGAITGIGVTTADGRLIDMNPAFCTMLGYTATELTDRNVLDLLDPDDAPADWQRYAERTHRSYAQTRCRRQDGGIIWTDLAVSVIRDDDGRPTFTVALLQDVTDRHEMQQRLQFQAEHDPLTGLPNRTLFFHELEAACERPAGRVGLCYLDLDGFKMVNDSLGHEVGDQLLVAVAARLTGCLSGRGHLVARMGGDEFAILLRDPADTAAVVAVAQEVLAAMTVPCMVAGHHLAPAVSIGVFDRATEGADPAEIMKIADITLYWAKSSGRGQVAVFDEQRHHRESDRHLLAAAMPGALDRGEFFVEYQPIVRFTDAGLHGVEALVRWRHPERGIIAPGTFIELAEESGLIVALGRYVLRMACQQAGQWHRDFPETRVVLSVNLASRQAHDVGIVDDVIQALDDTGLPRDLLELELTESAVMDPTGEALPSLGQLADLGLSIAIDDFGTGYSNMAYLRTLPIHRLKLAGPFVEGLRTPVPDPVDEQIVDALVRLGHALSLTVTAEAVETAEQAAVLRRIGCDSGQGHFFAKPMSAQRITDLLSCASRGQPVRVV